MTERAKKLSQAIEEVSWDWETMQPSHPHTIAVAAIRAMADSFVYDDNGIAWFSADDFKKLADELEAL